MNGIRRRPGWLVHCLKAVFRNYHRQLLLELSINRTEIMEFLRQRDYVVFALLNYSGKSRDPLCMARVDSHADTSTRNVLAVNNANQRALREIQDRFC